MKQRLNFKEIPIEFRESFILTGYRKPNSSIKSCLSSLFYLDNNEIINFWTHFLPFLFMAYKLFKLCSFYDLFNVHQDNLLIWPLFIYLVTVLFYLFMR
jgi:predicted membrane channel-forming protein YqfA (hemolysin III family)